MTKLEALAKHLEIDLNELTKEDDSSFLDGRREYLVLTDEEADLVARDYILDTVWAFNASFLAAHSGVDEDTITAIQKNNRCEGNNEVLLKLIDDKDHFVDDAILSDGRGHFISMYDGVEHEIACKDENGGFQYYYIYRTN